MCKAFAVFSLFATLLTSSLAFSADSYFSINMEYGAWEKDGVIIGHCKKLNPFESHAECKTFKQISEERNCEFVSIQFIPISENITVYCNRKKTTENQRKENKDLQK